MLVGMLQFQGFLPAKAADVEIPNSSNGVNLDTFSGSTANVASGVVVTNTGTLISTSYPGIYASAQSWILSNAGTITSATSPGPAIRFTAGGTINNSGSISSTTSHAIILSNGGTVNNLATGTISGTGSSSSFAINASGSPTTVDNAGTINGQVFITAGGTVTNQSSGTISVAVNNSVAVTVLGGTTRSVTNYGSIQSTGGGTSTGVEIGSGTGTGLLNNVSSGSIFGTFNGVYTGASVVLDLTNNGTIQANTGSAVEARGGGTITNTGIIENKGLGAAAESNGIYIHNAVTAEIINSGTITGGVNAINFTRAGGIGATHTVRLRTGSVLNGNVVGGTGTDNLILEGTGTENITKFSNFETLTMNGVDWTLSGTGTFSTTTTVQSGTLQVNGQLTSPAVGIQSGATLTGSGTVVGDVTNAGNVRVDSGTLTFNGNYIHQTGAFFIVGVTPSINGLLAITGAGHTATINGGTVSVLAGVGSYALNTQYTILTTTGGRSGTFSSVTSNFAFLDPSLTYDTNNVYLTLTRNSIDFASIGITPNQISAGGGLAALGMSNPIVSAALMLSPDQARAAFDSVSGEIHPSLHSLMIDESQLVRDAILGRQRQDNDQTGTSRAIAWASEDIDDTVTSSYARKARKAKGGPKWPIKAAPPAVAPVYGAWVQGYGNWTRLNGDGNAATLRSSTGGAIGGFDVTLNHNWRFGFAAGGGRTDARVDARLSSGTIDTFHLAAYGGGNIGDILFRTGAAYSHHDVSTSRTITFPGFADNAAAKYDAHTSQIFGEAAYRLNPGLVRSEAFANIAHVRVHSDSFSETGGPAALNVAAADTSTTFTTLGLRAQAPLPAFGSWAVTARGSLGWQHAFDTVPPVSWMAFAASTAPFAVAGVPIATDAALIEAGIDALVRSNTRLSLMYTARLAADASAHAVRANLAVRF